MKVTVVLVTYNSAAVVGEALDALPGALDGIEAYEVVVADNASTDDTVAIIERDFPEARLVHVGHNRGYAAGINAAVAAAAASDAVLILNPDVQLAPGAVARLADALDIRGVGIAAPRVVGPSGCLDHSLRREPTILRAVGEAVLGGKVAGRWPSLGEIVRREQSYREARSADWAVGAALLVSRECLDDVGPWDESFFLYSEETEFALRARDAGHRLRYVPDATAVHHRGDAPTNPRLWSIMQYNRYRLHRRRRGRLQGLGFRFALLLNAALRAPVSAVHRAAFVALSVPGYGRRLLAEHTTSPDELPGYVCFAGLDWWCHSRAHSDFQLMLRVAETRTVLLVNSIGMRMPMPGRTALAGRRIVRKARSVAKLLRQPVPELPRFHVMTPLSIPLAGRPRVRALNAAFVRLQVRLAMRFLRIDRAVCVVAIPTAWDVVQPMAWERLLYNRYDKHSAFGEVDVATIGALESELLRRSDAILYVSRGLMEEEAGLTGERAVFLDHGVDIEHFRRHEDELPPDVAALPGPLLGYFGAFRDYSTDLELLAHLARSFPDASVVLIGDAQCPMGDLERLPNVHWLGPRSYADIPRYGAAFDVALLPLLCNDFTRYANPIKLKEYLALELPVVTTDLPEVRPYGHLVRIAQDRDDFVAKVAETLHDAGLTSPGERRAAVLDAPWDRRAAELIERAEQEMPQHL